MRSDGLHTVPLSCGHSRRVADGIHRMIVAGHITTQACLVHRAEVAIGHGHQTATAVAIVARLLG